MDALRSVREVFANDVLVNIFCDERDKRSGHFGERYQAGVQRHVGVDLILAHALCPEAVSAAADVPVA